MKQRILAAMLLWIAVCGGNCRAGGAAFGALSAGLETPEVPAVAVPVPDQNSVLAATLRSVASDIIFLKVRGFKGELNPIFTKLLVERHYKAAGADRAAIKAELDKLYRLLSEQPVNEAAVAVQYPRTVSAAAQIDILDGSLREKLADINGRLVWLRQGAELYNLKEQKQEEGWFYSRMVEELEDLAYADQIGCPGVNLDALMARLAGKHYAERGIDRAAIIAAIDSMDAKLSAARPDIQASKAAYPGFIRTVSKADPFDKELTDRLYKTHLRVADIDPSALSLELMYKLSDVIDAKSSKHQWFLLDLFKFYLEPSLQEGIRNLQSMGAR